MKRKFTKALIALLIIAGGVCLILDAVGLLQIALFKGWWTLLLIVPALLSIVTNRPDGGSLFLLGLGVILLLNANGVLEGMKIWLMIVGLGVVCVGLGLVIKPFPKKTTIRTGEEEHYAAVFSSTDSKNISKDFKGADCTAIFGSLTLDLQEVSMEKDAVVTATAAFSSMEIIVPPQVTVKIAGTPVFGSIEDRTSPGMDMGHVLYINCTVAFGTVEIREYRKKK